MIDKSKETRKNYDGGLAWLLVVGTFGVQCFGVALSRSYGVLLPIIIQYYDTTYSKASWIAGLKSFSVHLASPIVTTLAHHYGCRPVVLVGGLIGAAGLLASAWVPSVDHFAITYGLLFGAGVSVALGPPLVMISKNFEKRRGTATVFSFTGGGFSGMIMPPLVGYLERQYSLRGSLFILAGICLHMQVFGMLLHDFWAAKKTRKSVNEVKVITSQPKASCSSQQLFKDNLPADEDFTEQKNNNGELINKQSSTDNVYTISKSVNAQHPMQSRKLPSDSRLSDAFTDETVVRRFSSFAQSRRPSKASLQSVALDDSDITLVGFKQLEPHASQQPNHLGANELLIESIEPTTTLRKTDGGDNSYQSCCSCVFLGKLCFKCNPKDSRPTFFDLSLLKEKAFLVYAFSIMLSYVAVLSVSSSLVSHAEDNGVERVTAQLMLSVIAGLNVASRIFFGWFVDTKRVHVLLIYVFLLVTQGGAVIMLSFAKGHIAIWGFTVGYGLVGSTCMPLKSVVLAHVLGVERLHSSYGLNSLFQAAAAISFPYFLGMIRDVNGSWNYSLLLVGSMSICGGLFILVEGIAKGRFTKVKQETAT